MFRTNHIKFNYSLLKSSFPSYGHDNSYCSGHVRACFRLYLLLLSCAWWCRIKVVLFPALVPWSGTERDCSWFLELFDYVDCHVKEKILKRKSWFCMFFIILLSFFVPLCHPISQVFKSSHLLAIRWRLFFSNVIWEQKWLWRYPFSGLRSKTRPSYLFSTT